MDAAERKEILSRYMDHQRRFEAVAAKRQNGNAEVIPFNGPLRELEQEPDVRTIRGDHVPLHGQLFGGEVRVRAPSAKLQRSNRPSRRRVGDHL